MERRQLYVLESFRRACAVARRHPVADAPPASLAELAALGRVVRGLRAAAEAQEVARRSGSGAPRYREA